MTGPGTFDDRTEQREPCLCGRLVSRRALCAATTADECPLPPAGSHRCASYRGEAVQALWIDTDDPDSNPYYCGPRRRR